MKTKKTKRAPRKKTVIELPGHFYLDKGIPFTISRDTHAALLSPAGHTIRTTCGAIYDKIKQQEAPTLSPVNFKVKRDPEVVNEIMKQPINEDGRTFLKNAMAEEEPDLYDAVRSFREDHTGPALTKKFISDIDKHVPFTDLPSIAREILAAFSAKAMAEKNLKGDRYDQAAKEAEQARAIYNEMQSIFNNKIQ